MRSATRPNKCGVCLSEEGGQCTSSPHRNLRGFLLVLAGVMCQSEGWATRFQHVAVAHHRHLIPVTFTWLSLLLFYYFTCQLCLFQLARASESPDRECCESQYPYLPAPPYDPQTTPAYPEVPDWFDYPRPTVPYVDPGGSWGGDVTIEQQAIATTTRRTRVRTRRPTRKTTVRRRNNNNVGQRRTTPRQKAEKEKDKATTPRWTTGLSKKQFLATQIKKCSSLLDNSLGWEKVKT